MASINNISESIRTIILGVCIDDFSIDQLLKYFRDCVEKNHKIVVSYVNIYAINNAYSIPWFKDFLNSSSITYCDGFGIKLAAWLSGQTLHHRSTPPDFIDDIAYYSDKLGWKIFFLGGKTGVAQKAMSVLLKKYPNLQIASYHGYFDKSSGSEENTEVISMINKFQPNLLVVGFGMPLQEKWIRDNFNQLKINIAFPAGAMFDYISGVIPRSPRLMTEHGMEWLGRLIIEPRRLWKRYLIGIPVFFWRVFIHIILKHPLPAKVSESADEI